VPRGNENAVGTNQPIVRVEQSALLDRGGKSVIEKFANLVRGEILKKPATGFGLQLGRNKIVRWFNVDANDLHFAPEAGNRSVKRTLLVSFSAAAR